MKDYSRKLNRYYMLVSLWYSSEDQDLIDTINDTLNNHYYNDLKFVDFLETTGL